MQGLGRWGLLLSLVVLSACVPEGKSGFDALNSEFAQRPEAWTESPVALWISEYQEEDDSRRFQRSTALGTLPDKLTPEGPGIFSATIPLVRESETSDGPLPDQLVPLFIRVIKLGDRFQLQTNEALPGVVQGWTDTVSRVVHFRAVLRTQEPSHRLIRWELKGSY